MHRFYLPPEQCRGPVFTLTGREAHHALRVLRAQRGECVTVLDGAGQEFLCEVCGASKQAVQLTATERKSIPPLPCEITLLQAIPKGKIIEDIIEKATELGAHRIVPILSQRVTTRLDEAEKAEKATKWRLAAIEAIKQCGSAWLPQVDLPSTIQDFLALQRNFDLSLIASLQGDRPSAREHFANFRAKHGRRPASVCVWVGPEGDFTPEATDAIRASGALPITLGRFVLRCETAAVYCLSVLNYELQERVGADG